MYKVKDNSNYTGINYFSIFTTAAKKSNNIYGQIRMYRYCSAT